MTGRNHSFLKPISLVFFSTYTGGGEYVMNVDDVDRTSTSVVGAVNPFKHSSSSGNHFFSPYYEQ